MPDLPSTLRTLPILSSHHVIFRIPDRTVVVRNVDQAKDIEKIGKDVIAWGGPKTVGSSSRVRDGSAIDFGYIRPPCGSASLALCYHR